MPRPQPVTDRRRYNDLTVAQLLRWHNGQPVHHAMTGECCPDFSCCYPDLYEADPVKRMAVLRKAIERSNQSKDADR